MVLPAPQMGYTVFCDDIRQESTGKYLLIGVYADAMICGMRTPLKLPRLSFFITYLERSTEEVEDITLEIQFPGETETQAQFSQMLALSQNPPMRTLDIDVPVETELVRKLLIPITLEDVLLEQPGVFRVWAVRAGERISLGVLPVTVAPDAVPSNFSLAELETGQHPRD